MKNPKRPQTSPPGRSNGQVLLISLALILLCLVLPVIASFHSPFLSGIPGAGLLAEEIRACWSVVESFLHQVAAFLEDPRPYLCLLPIGCTG